MFKNGETRGRILVFIKGYVDYHGYAPSYEEIAEYVGVKSTSTVHHHMQVLLEDGRLETDLPKLHSRAYRVVRMTPRKK